jgi:hypothetical protein
MEWDGLGMWLIWERLVVHRGFQRGDLRERGHLEDLCLTGRIILKWILKTWDLEA